MTSGSGRSVWFLALFALMICNSSLFGQGCCSGGVPISGNLGLPAGNKGSVQLQLTLDHNLLDQLYTGTARLEDDTRLRTTSSLLLEGSYGLTERFTVSGLLSYVRQTRNISTLPGSSEFTGNAGLGDAILLARYNFLIDSTAPNTDLLIGIGPKFPLGRTDYTDSRGILLPADLQPGTGSWDAVFWGFFSHTGLLRRTMAFTAIPSFRVTGTNDRYSGSQTYRFGNEFQFNFGFSDRFVTKWVMIDPLLMFRFRSTAPDQAEGQIVSNTGGRWLHVLPGVAWGITPSLTVRMNGEVPLFRNLTGTQLTTTYRATLALFYSFSPGRSRNSILKNSFHGS